MVADPARTNWLAQWRYAHRGLHGGTVVENSPSAFRKAIAAGLGIECDIQRSLDDWPMVFHDWDLERLFRRREAGEAVLLADWRALRYTNGDPPITLAELLELVAGQVPLLIEIKSRKGYDVEWTCRRVADCLDGNRGKHAVMSFDPRVPRWFARHSPDTVRGMVVTEENGRDWTMVLMRWLRFAASRAEFLACDVRDLPTSFAAAVRRSGLPVLCWTVKDKELAARAALYADAPIAEGAGL